MENPRIVLGLRTEKRMTPPHDESDDGNFFSSSSDNINLLLTKREPLMNTFSRESKHKIVGFSDISLRINPLVSQMEEYCFPDRYSGPLYLIPENSLSPEDNQKIIDYIAGNIDEFDLIPDNFDDDIAAQLQLVKYIQDRSLDIKKYLQCNIDSRISSLINYALTDNSDPSISAHFFLSALEDAIKSNDYAPISILFDQYSIPNMIEQLAYLLVQLFPRHPILPSVIHNLAKFSPEATNALDELPDNNSDDDSDSFYEFLKHSRSSQSSFTPLQSFVEKIISNPLDFSNNVGKIETYVVSVSEPPFTMTYYLDDENHDTFPTLDFFSWLQSFRTKQRGAMKPQASMRNILRETPRHNFHQVTASVSPSLSNQDHCCEINETYLVSLFSLIHDRQSLLNALPSSPPANLFHLYYPTLQILSAMANTPVKRGCIEPVLISHEFDAHAGLCDPNAGSPSRAIAGFLSFINQHEECLEGFELDPILPLEQKRYLPNLQTNQPKSYLPYLAAADIEFIVNGRSPFTGVRLSGPLSFNDKHPIMKRINRALFLYKYYSTTTLPPYFAFRIGFATALAIGEAQPSIACDLMFEVVYLIHSVFPQLSKVPIVRSAVLFFAETLERSDRYYHSTMVFDNYFLSDISDSSSAAAIAQIAQRNGDTVRALFHYIESFKSLLLFKKWDESLYLGQIIASICSNNGLLSHSLSILGFLLKNAYKIKSLNRFDQPIPVTSGTLRLSRPTLCVIAIPDNCPNPSSINTMLVCSLFIEILIRQMYFNIAEETLNILCSTTEGSVLGLITDYLRSKLLLKKNMFLPFLESIPRFEARLKPSNSAAHISLLAGVNFDAPTAILRMLTRSHLERNLFITSLFWSEVIIQTCPKNSMRVLGCGFLWRGMSLAQAYSYSHSFPEYFSLSQNLSPFQQSFGQYRSPNFQYNQRSVLNEALSSFLVARICFERCGSLRKEIETSLRYTDLLLLHFFDPYNANHEPSTVAITHPRFQVEVKARHYQHNIRITESVLNKESVIDEISRILDICEKNSARIMIPTLIIYSQVLSARLFALKRKPDLSLKYIDYTINNISKYCCGPHWVLRALSTTILHYFENIVELLGQVLQYFEPNEINDRLIVYDILSDLRGLIASRYRNVCANSMKPLVPSPDMDTQALQLRDPRFPDFMPSLRESGYLGNDFSIEEEKDLSFDSFFRMLTSNVRLFESQKITEDQMHSRNRKICHRIEVASSRIQVSHKYPFPKYSIAEKRSPATHRTVLLLRLFNAIVVYLPFNGLRHVTPLTISNQIHNVKFQSMGIKTAFQSQSSIITEQVIRTILGFMLVDKKTDLMQKPAYSLLVCQQLKECLFGNLLTTVPLFSNKATIVPDHLDSDGSWIFKPNGRLKTINPGLDKSIIFIVSRDLSALPLELMFNDSLVIRLPAFSNLLLRRFNHSSQINAMSFRRPINANKLRADGIKGSIEEMENFISSLGGALPTVPYVDGIDRTMPFPLPIFASNKSNEYYSELYPFCTFVPISPGSHPPAIRADGLYIFSFTDLCVLPVFVERVVREFPHAFIMFIPDAICTKAFEYIRFAMERREQRFRNNSNDYLYMHPMEFIASIQLTLIRKFFAPVSIYLPISN